MHCVDLLSGYGCVANLVIVSIIGVHKVEHPRSPEGDADDNIFYLPPGHHVPQGSSLSSQSPVCVSVHITGLFSSSGSVQCLLLHYSVTQFYIELTFLEQVQYTTVVLSL